MINAAIAPEAALRSTFGETLNGPLARIIVRGALIALSGAMLIYGAAATDPVMIALFACYLLATRAA